MKRIPKSYYAVMEKKDKSAGLGKGFAPVKLFRDERGAVKYVTRLQEENVRVFGTYANLNVKKVADKGSIRQFRRRFGDLK